VRLSSVNAPYGPVEQGQAVADDGVAPAGVAWGEGLHELRAGAGQAGVAGLAPVVGTVFGAKRRRHPKGRVGAELHRDEAVVAMGKAGRAPGAPGAPSGIGLHEGPPAEPGAKPTALGGVDRAARPEPVTGPGAKARVKVQVEHVLDGGDPAGELRGQQGLPAKRLPARRRGGGVEQALDSHLGELLVLGPGPQGTRGRRVRT